MSETLKPKSAVIKLDEIAPGIRGRLIPPEESDVDEDYIRKLAEQNGSNEYSKFIYRIYKIKPKATDKPKATGKPK